MWKGPLRDRRRGPKGVTGAAAVNEEWEKWRDVPGEKGEKENVSVEGRQRNK